MQPQLDEAIKTSENNKNQVAKYWAEYTQSQQAEQKALADLAPKRIDLEAQGQQLLQEINAAKQFVTQQSNLLQDEIDQAEALITQLKTQREATVKQLSTATGNNKNNLLSLQNLLDQNINLLGQKAAVLISQQTSFVQKQTLLNTQKQLIETQYQLLDTYIASPDKDTSSLEKLLADTRASLADAQKLAQQAEASSTALTAIMDDVQASLLLQTDKYLSAIRDQDQKLEEMLAESKLQENLTLQATQKQIEINALSPKIEEVLKRAVDAGNKQVTKLLESVRNNNFATSAEIIYRDYSDLGGDKGNWCVKGIARPEDRVIAADAYNKMLAYRDLKAKADQQAAEFGQLRTLAESQLTVLKDQQALANKELADLRQSIGNSQDILKAKQEELAIAQFRTDALSQIRNWTEQTINQVLVLEKSNLAQAKLEEEIAKNRSTVIGQALNAKLEKDRQSLDRDRQIAVAHLQQLAQIKTEEALQTAINGLRNNLGISPIDNIIQKAEQNGQLAGILNGLDRVLSTSFKDLLAATTQDINQVLQGKEAKTIQENLLKTADVLIKQSNILKAEETKLNTQIQKYTDLLKQSQTNLQAATKTLYDEIQKSGVLAQERDLLSKQNQEILYKVAYAKNAGEISASLAEQSKKILEQIIDGRIEERKARKKELITEILGIVSKTLSIFSLIPSPISLALKLSSVALGAAASAINGDWKGAIFNVAMGAADFVGKSLSIAIKAGTTSAFGLSAAAAENIVSKIDLLKPVASGIYYGIKASESGNIGDFLKVVGDLASVGMKISFPTDQPFNLTYQILNTLKTVPLQIYSGIEAINRRDWLTGIQDIAGGIFNLSENIAYTLSLPSNDLDKFVDLLTKLEFVTNTGLTVAQAIKQNNLSGWLSGIKGVISTYSEYNDKQDQLIANVRELDRQGRKNLALKDDGLIEFAKKQNISLDKVWRDDQGVIYQIIEVPTRDGKVINVYVAEGFNPNLETIVIVHGYKAKNLSEWMVQIADGYKQQSNKNVIMVDWTELGRELWYFSPAKDTRLVGQTIAETFYGLGIDPTKMTVIGHSLGAQVASVMGEYFQNKYQKTLAEIQALDPANPQFENKFLWWISNPSTLDRLDSSDAKNVEVIHSDEEGLFHLGYAESAGSKGTGFDQNGSPINTKDISLT